VTIGIWQVLLLPQGNGCEISSVTRVTHSYLIKGEHAMHGKAVRNFVHFLPARLVREPSRQ
jgi:hypothetical protein